MLVYEISNVSGYFSRIKLYDFARDIENRAFLHDNFDFVILKPFLSRFSPNLSVSKNIASEIVQDTFYK